MKRELSFGMLAKLFLFLSCACACSEENDSGDSGTGGSSTDSASGGRGGDTTGGSGGAPAMGGTGSGGVPATGGTDGAAAAGGSDSGSAPGEYKPICGCRFDSAEDHTGDASVMVSFGGVLGDSYSPSCIKVSPSTAVTFAGSFSFHPLSAYTDASRSDEGNPVESTTAGETATFTYEARGSFGYFCTEHEGEGMCGAVYVVP